VQRGWTLWPHLARPSVQADVDVVHACPEEGSVLAEPAQGLLAGAIRPRLGLGVKVKETDSAHGEERDLKATYTSWLCLVNGQSRQVFLGEQLQEDTRVGLSISKAQVNRPIQGIADIVRQKPKMLRRSSGLSPLQSAVFKEMTGWDVCASLTIGSDKADGRAERMSLRSDQLFKREA
jgi:hypothetical protein